MKKSKRIAALIAAVLMTVTMFTSAIPAYAAAAANTSIGTDTYGSNKITGYRSALSKTEMSARTVSNKKASTIAATIVVRNVNSKGNIVKANGTPDKSADNATASGLANVTSGSGNHFEYIYIMCAAIYDNNINHNAYTDYTYEF